MLLYQGRRYRRTGRGRLNVWHSSFGACERPVGMSGLLLLGARLLLPPHPREEAMAPWHCTVLATRVRPSQVKVRSSLGVASKDLKL